VKSNNHKIERKNQMDIHDNVRFNETTAAGNAYATSNLRAFLNSDGGVCRRDGTPIATINGFWMTAFTAAERGRVLNTTRGAAKGAYGQFYITGKGHIATMTRPTDYDAICDFGNLHQAHMETRKGKSHKGDVIKFELNLMRNLLQIKEELDNCTYTVKGYYKFTVHEPKERIVYAAYYRDRVVNHCLCMNALRPIIQPRLIHDNAACQPGKGTHFALKRLSRFLHEHYKEHGTVGYFLKCDIRKYFATIDHEILKKRISWVAKDENVKNLMFMIIDSFESEKQSGKGIPLGNQTSQWFALYYLDPVDRLIKERLRNKHYVRYMDDLVLIHESKTYLQNVLNCIRSVIEDGLQLSLNDKTQIFPIKNGVEFLGFHMYLSDSGKVIRKLKVATKKRYKKRMLELPQDYAAGRIDLPKVENILASYKGHLKHGHTYRLMEQTMEDFDLRRE